MIPTNRDYVDFHQAEEAAIKRELEVACGFFKAFMHFCQESDISIRELADFSGAAPQTFEMRKKSVLTRKLYLINYQVPQP